MATIVFDAVDKVFRDPGKQRNTVAVENFSLDIADGELMALLGPSGCGKSTVLNMLAGFDRPSAGRISVDGVAVQAPGPDRAVVFQEPMLFPWLSVVDNVAFGPRMAGRALVERRRSASAMLDKVGLNAFGEHRPYELSGGMRQRAAIARAWVMRPRILLMDEPFGALDAQTRLMMQEMLVALWEETRITTVFVTHDIEEALFLADRICVMRTRPGGIRRIYEVPFARPRRYEELIDTPDFGHFKREIVRAVRAETLREKST